MALIKCPECGKEISDRAINCINCGYPIGSRRVSAYRDSRYDAPSQDDDSETEGDEDSQESPNISTADDSAKTGATGVLIIGVILALISGIFNASVLMGVGVIFILIGIIGLAKLGGSSGSSSLSQQLTCPRCKSTNISVGMAYTERVKGFKSEVRKKSPITRVGNSIGRAGMIMATGGLWALTPKRSRYKTVGKVKSKSIAHKDAICQRCGYSWKV